MFELGSSLRQARQHRGLALADVERETRIRAKYLGALEDERFDVLPGVAYVRGFLRTYADFLELNATLYVDEYNTRFAPAPEEEQPPISRRPAVRRSLPFARPLAILLTLAVGATIVVWQLGFTGAQHTTITGERLQVPEASAASARARATPAAPKTAPAASAVHVPRTLVVDTARGDCWVSVRIGSQNGKVVYEGVVPQGHTLRFGLGQTLWVRLGAPWNVDVTIRGRAVTGLPHQPVNLTAR